VNDDVRAVSKLLDIQDDEQELLTLSVEPSLNAREELAAGCYCGDDTRVRGRRALEP